MATNGIAVGDVAELASQAAVAGDDVWRARLAETDVGVEVPAAQGARQFERVAGDDLGGEWAAYYEVVSGQWAVVNNLEGPGGGFGTAIAAFVELAPFAVEFLDDNGNVVPMGDGAVP